MTAPNVNFSTMTRLFQTKLLPIDQLLFWILLTLFTSVYFFLYDSLYLARDIEFINTLSSTSKAWGIWLLLMPVAFRLITFEHPFSVKNFQHTLLVSASCVVISLLSQWLIFFDQTGIKSTLLFCYLPANLKIMWLLLVLIWFKSKYEKQDIKQSKLLCQDQKAQNIELAIDQIHHIQADGNYLHIHTAAETFIKRATISQTAQQLQKAGIIRVHRSHLININKIKQLKNKSVFMNNGSEVPIGRTYQSVLKNAEKIT